MQVMAATDAQLIRRAHEDSEALATLYLRYRDRLYAWFRARAPEAAASELTAELFAQVALGLKRFRDEADGSAAPWLYGIAKNLLRRLWVPIIRIPRFCVMACAGGSVMDRVRCGVAFSGHRLRVGVLVDAPAARAAGASASFGA